MPARTSIDDDGGASVDVRLIVLGGWPSIPKQALSGVAEALGPRCLVKRLRFLLAEAVPSPQPRDVARVICMTQGNAG